VFEIGNEPNLYPYMAPKLYAWSYFNYRAAILAEARSRGLADKVRIMPAGLWTWQGAPRALTNLVTAKFGPHAADAMVWYTQFLVWLGNMALDPELISADEPVHTGQDALLRAAPLVDIANIHFYPWVAEGHCLDPALSPGEIVTRDLESLERFARFASRYSSTREVWLTELGNINPLDDRAVADTLMPELLRGLERLNRRGSRITRWYWFKATGDDRKFKMIPNIEQLEFAEQHLVAAIAFALQVSAEDAKGCLAILKRWRITTPAQGLYDEHGNLRRMGKLYLQRAGVRRR